jgi:hypothetical protein
VSGWIYVSVMRAHQPVLVVVQDVLMGVQVVLIDDQDDPDRRSGSCWSCISTRWSPITTS